MLITPSPENRIRSSGTDWAAGRHRGAARCSMSVCLFASLCFLAACGRSGSVPIGVAPTIDLTIDEIVFIDWPTRPDEIEMRYHWREDAPGKLTGDPGRLVFRHRETVVVLALTDQMVFQEGGHQPRRPEPTYKARVELTFEPLGPRSYRVAWRSGEDGDYGTGSVQLPMRTEERSLRDEEERMDRVNKLRERISGMKLRTTSDTP